MDIRIKQNDTKLYIILVGETKIIKLRLEVRRATKYEEKARQSKKKIVMECIKDLERKRTKGE